MPPTTTTTKMIEPTVAAMDGSVRNMLPPMTPASPARPVPAPKTSMNTRGTLWPSASTISGCVSADWTTRPIRVRVSSSQTDTSMTSATSIMKPRVAGNGEQTTRTAASVALHRACGTAPRNNCKPSTEWLTNVNKGPRNASGGLKSSATRPQTNCTNSSTT